MHQIEYQEDILTKVNRDFCVPSSLGRWRVEGHDCTHAHGCLCFMIILSSSQKHILNSGIHGRPSTNSLLLVPSWPLLAFCRQLIMKSVYLFQLIQWCLSYGGLKSDIQMNRHSMTDWQTCLGNGLSSQLVQNRLGFLHRTGRSGGRLQSSSGGVRSLLLVGAVIIGPLTRKWEFGMSFKS